LASRLDVRKNWYCIETSTKDLARDGPKGMKGIMNIADRMRHRRMINRERRAIDRAWQSAPTQAMRDEIMVMAQRKPF
jgi:hypothetical protein